MTSLNTREPVRYSRKWVPLLAFAALALAACSGDRGEPGSQGSGGPVGPPGAPPGGGVPVTSAKVIKASIVSATVPEDGKPVVEVRLVNESDRPLAGLPAANISFVLARLEPVVNGKPSTWHAVTRRTETAGSVSKNQGTTEAATKGQWVESSLKNGVYTYTFAQSLKGISDIPYDASLVHRVGLEIRTSTGALTTENIPANNAVFTWAPASGIPLAQSGREIVDNDTCNACHDNLAVHGNGRFDLQYCVMCHESYSFDAQSGNSLDLKVMIHKIHSGATLPSVVNDPDDPSDNGTYGIYGYGNEFANFSDLHYPQDKRNCQTCHQESDADTPQASNWRITVAREPCGACHDNVNFDTGENHGGVAATDDQCVSCHGPNSNVQEGKLRPQVAHLIPEQEAAKNFKFEVVKVEAIKTDGSAGATTCAATAKVCKILPGEFAKVTIKVSNPNTGTAWKLTDAPFTNVIPPPPGSTRSTTARVRVRVAYTTQNYTSPESGQNPGQPILIDYLAAPAPTLNADGSYTKAATVAIPNGLIGGSGVVFLEGRVIPEYEGELVEAGPTSSDPAYFAITDSAPVPRRSIVDVKKCDDCHNVLQAHGDNRNDQTGLCAVCHNPELAELPSGATVGEPFDFKVMVHAIHAGKLLGDLDFTGFAERYPGKINNCEGCHVAGSYYPVDPTKVFATSVQPGASTSTPSDDAAWTPNAAVCGSCHTESISKLHMEQNGGSYGATKNADGTSIEAPLETCGTCHGEGGIADVKVEHGVGEFNYN